MHTVLARELHAGVTAAFIKNGMRHALRVLGQPDEAAHASNWAYQAVVNPQLQQVRSTAGNMPQLNYFSGCAPLRVH